MSCSGPTAELSQFEALDAYVDALDVRENDSEHNHQFLIQVLHKAQEVFGYLPEPIQRYVADKLYLHFVDVYGVVSFYSYFTMRMPGKYRLSVCMGTACYVKGADRILEVLQEKLGIEPGQTTDDGLYSLDMLRCVGACGIAPVVLVNDKAYGHVTNAKVLEIIQECASGEL